MAEKNNATCAICGKGYHMCLSCKDEMKAKPWKLHTCCSEHYKIFSVIKGYTFNVYTKSEAKKRLQKIDLSDLDALRDNIKDIINEIMSSAKKKDNFVEHDNDNDEVVSYKDETAVDSVNQRDDYHSDEASEEETVEASESE